MTPAKTERFEMRLDQSILDRVDAWRSQQQDLPSRAEAVRRLMDAGLGLNRREPRLRGAEKLSLTMLCDLYKHFKVDTGINPDLIKKIIYGGHYWAFRWVYDGIFHDHEDDRKTVSEVVDILDMWSFIERAYNKMSEKEKEQIKTDAEPFGTGVRFRGFDGNNESEHFHIALFLINDLDRFSNFEGRELNSHSPSIDTHRRMFCVFEPMRSSLVGRELDTSEIIEILKAKRHPDYAGNARD